MEFHSQLCQSELRSLCKQYGVCFQAYSSLGKGELLNEPLVNEVAKNCGRTPAQVGLPAEEDQSHGEDKLFMSEV